MNFRRIAVTVLASGALLTGGTGLANASTSYSGSPHSGQHQQYNNNEHRQYKQSDHRYSEYQFDNRDHKDHLWRWDYKYDQKQHKKTWQWDEH